MIPEHEAQAMMERGAYLVDRVNLDRLARQVMSAEEAAAFVVLVEAHAADLARLLEERETLREVTACAHDWDLVEREGKAWHRCRLCPLSELWEGGMLVAQEFSASPEEARDDA